MPHLKVNPLPPPGGAFSVWSVICHNPKGFNRDATATGVPALGDRVPEHTDDESRTQFSHLGPTGCLRSAERDRHLVARLQIRKVHATLSASRRKSAAAISYRGNP